MSPTSSNMTKKSTPPTAGEDAEQRKFLYVVSGDIK